MARSTDPALQAWTIARRSTGRLLEQLLSHSDDPAFTFPSESYSLGVDGAPVAVVEDDDTAVVLGGVRTSAAGAAPIPGAAVLVASTAAPRTWLVASLDIAAAADNDFQRAISTVGSPKRSTPASSSDTVPRHEGRRDRLGRPHRRTTQELEWTTMVADALSELAEWDQRAWTWIADECAMFGGLYLRARHPELVRQY